MGPFANSGGRKQIFEKEEMFDRLNKH